MTPLSACLLAVPAGGLLGYLQLVGLRRDVRRYLESGVQVSGVLAHGLRLLGISGLFLALAPLGAAALLGALLGWTVLRALLLLDASSRTRWSSR